MPLPPSPARVRRWAAAAGARSPARRTFASKVAPPAVRLGWTWHAALHAPPAPRCPGLVAHRCQQPVVWEPKISASARNGHSVQRQLRFAVSAALLRHEEAQACRSHVAKTTLTVLFSHVLSDFDATSASGRLGDVCQPACGQGPVDALGYCIHLSGLARSCQNVARYSFEAASTMLVRLLGSWPSLDS